MRTKKAYLSIIIITLLVAGCFISVANAQSPSPEPTPTASPVPPPEFISVVLEKPDNNTVKTDSFNVTFTFKPTLVGSDKFVGANLVLNGTMVADATNQTVIANNTSNSFYYVLPSNGTYLWNIRLQNTTSAVTAPENFTLTASVYVAPEATPTPEPTATPAPVTPAPTITAAPPTESPTPTPAPSGLDTWTIVIIVIILVAGFGAIAIMLLRHKH